jgi:hypothetical protein
VIPRQSFAQGRQIAYAGSPPRGLANMSQLLRLTDAQLDAVLRAAQPLAPADRGAFLEGELAGE